MIQIIKFNIYYLFLSLEKNIKSNLSIHKWDSKVLNKMLLITVVRERIKQHLKWN